MINYMTKCIYLWIEYLLKKVITISNYKKYQEKQELFSKTVFSVTYKLYKNS